MNNRLSDDSEDSDDSEEMYNRNAPPPVVNHQRPASVHEPINGTRPQLRYLDVNQTLVYDAKSINRNKQNFSPENHVQVR
jgi:hypothetical protein